jgi:DNA-binding PadR family transcriptional regulator
MRLADRGLLETAWESDAPAGRPPRHLYRLTGLGLDLAVQLAETPASSPKERVSAEGARLGLRAEGA